MPYPLIIFKNICKKLDLILWSTMALIPVTFVVGRTIRLLTNFKSF